MSSRILKQEVAEDIAFNFNPQKFPVEVPESASQFVQSGEAPQEGSSFKLNELISKQIGVSENEKARREEEIDALAVEKLKEIQEQSYKEAYELGLEEGRKEAFEACKEEFLGKIGKINETLEKITHLKKDLVAFNEAHIMKTIGLVASKIAFREIEIDKESILPVIASVMERSQAEEKVKVRISPEDFEFLQGLENELNKKIENYETIKLEADSSISSGGCIVEGNYGVVDATLEERVEKVWKVFAEKAPSVKDEVA